MPDPFFAFLFLDTTNYLLHGEYNKAKSNNQYILTSFAILIIFGIFFFNCPPLARRSSS
jgi:hypothetical protein